MNEKTTTKNVVVFLYFLPLRQDKVDITFFILSS